MVLFEWKLNRYARCYSDSRLQYCDSRQTPLFDLLSCMQHVPAASGAQGASTSMPFTPISDADSARRFQKQTNQSQQLGAQADSQANSSWMAISSNEHHCLGLQLQIDAMNSVTLGITCQNTNTNSTVQLERLQFPSALLQNQLKISPRPSSLGLRYIISGSHFLFQVIFPSVWECRLCYDLLSQLNLLTSTWWNEEDLSGPQTPAASFPSDITSNLNPRHYSVHIPNQEGTIFTNQDGYNDKATASQQNANHELVVQLADMSNPSMVDLMIANNEDVFSMFSQHIREKSDELDEVLNLQIVHSMSDQDPFEAFVAQSSTE